MSPRNAPSKDRPYPDLDDGKRGIADAAPGALVFNRTVTLRDTWAKIAKAGWVGVRAGITIPGGDGSGRQQIGG